ncbi:MAG: oligopeptide transporter, OPT family [Paludibacterium sp.]|uniref:OPT family oligopeptide transporter n=1 Tax=Paludibacterium sp. TaxID=1917523 RepID=UPI0025FA21FA|nr:oligopeptide transporter, OPT family [Paludibacterium sp.]MBV8048798.1 oligopeptide transporter, OPT family [Paludibacterium sp.]MBV8645908.1 oligopeptide transporter, OPT family [Paludibacterium sp.]
MDGTSTLGGGVIVFIIGLILAAVFAASTAYSGMKAGLTVAAGIPGAIIGTGLINMFAKKHGILGKNLLQGMSSAGESVASGLIFVLPSILLIGSQFSFLEGLLAGVGGVLFGIGVASIVHNYLLVDEHGKLMYPESMAISETLVASDAGGESLKYMGIGFGIGGLVTLVTGAVFGWINNVISYIGTQTYKYRFEMEVNPMLLGIGFIVGLEISLTMFAGSIMSNFAVIPLIGYFSDMAAPGLMVWNKSKVAIHGMPVGVIASSYVKYIGAGMMLCGGIIGAIKLIPVIIGSIKETLGAKASGANGKETQYLKILLLGAVISFIAGLVGSGGNVMMAIVGGVLSLILMVLFVIVSGRLTGTIGTSNLPVSGMTIASLVLVTMSFVLMGWHGLADNKALLLFGSLIVVAVSIAGGYMQTQKVTFLIGGHKNEMQRFYALASIVGVVVVVGTIMILSKQLANTGADAQFGLPQANLMATLTSGIMSGKLPWVMIFVGVFMALVLYFLNLPIMTVAIGFYLPISTTSIILVGSLLRILVEKTSKNEADKDAKVAHGISLSSGLVAGGSIIGLIGIILQVSGIINLQDLTGFAASNEVAILLLAVLVILTLIPLITAKTHHHHAEK